MLKKCLSIYNFYLRIKTPAIRFRTWKTNTVVFFVKETMKNDNVKQHFFDRASTCRAFRWRKDVEYILFKVLLSYFKTPDYAFICFSFYFIWSHKVLSLSRFQNWNFYVYNFQIHLYYSFRWIYKDENNEWSLFE